MAAARTQPLAAASDEIQVSRSRSHEPTRHKQQNATYCGAGQLSLAVEFPGESLRLSLSLSLSLSLWLHEARDRVASISLSSLSRCFLPLFLSRWLWCRSNAAGVAAACERWLNGGAEGTEQCWRYGTGGARAARVHLLHVRTKNGRGVPFGAARRLLLPRLPLSLSAARATGRYACKRARFKSRRAAYAPVHTLYMCARYTPHPDWAYPGRNRGKEGRKIKVLQRVRWRLFLYYQPQGHLHLVAPVHIYKIFVQNNHIYKERKKLYKKN